MLSKLKIIHHSHSGRIRPHQHTSYIPLMFLVLVVGVLLFKISLTAFVAADSPGPEAGSIGLTGTVPTEPPQESAVILTPSAKQRFATSPIPITGTCPASTFVEIFKNSIFAGSVPCGSDGKFSLQIDLLYGENVLTAQVYDVLNQAGPISDPITVYYDALPPAGAPLSVLNLGGSQLLLLTDAVYKGSFPNQSFNVPITIVGGVAPFAVTIEWGDSNTKVIPRGDNSLFNASYAYKKPGTYKVTLRGTDSQQRVAFLTVAVVVNGQAVVDTNSTIPRSTQSLKNKLFVLWPLFAIAATMVISFWVGEIHEKRVLKKSTQPNPSFGVTPHLST